MMNAASTVTLNNGRKMPWLGLGVFKMTDPAQLKRAVHHAIEVGYRHIDTAAGYGNESMLGSAIAETSLDRSELFVTTKIANGDIRARRVPEAFQECIDNLGTDYVDLLLIHWPVGEEDCAIAWRAMEQFYAAGRARSIGVSNFLPHHLDDLARSWEVVPAVNQMEFHPYLQVSEQREACGARGIQFESWSPLMQGKVLSDTTLKSIADKHGKAVAQVVLRWNLQMKVCTIPKSVTSERIAANADLYDFELDENDMKRIRKLDRGERIGPDPDNFDF